MFFIVIYSFIKIYFKLKSSYFSWKRRNWHCLPSNMLLLWLELPDNFQTSRLLWMLLLFTVQVHKLLRPNLSRECDRRAHTCKKNFCGFSESGDMLKRSETKAHFNQALLVPSQNVQVYLNERLCCAFAHRCFLPVTPKRENATKKRWNPRRSSCPTAIPQKTNKQKTKKLKERLLLQM